MMMIRAKKVYVVHKFFLPEWRSLSLYSIFFAIACCVYVSHGTFSTSQSLRHVFFFLSLVARLFRIGCFHTILIIIIIIMIINIFAAETHISINFLIKKEIYEYRISHSKMEVWSKVYLGIFCVALWCAWPESSMRAEKRKHNIFLIEILLLERTKIIIIHLPLHVCFISFFLVLFCFAVFSFDFDIMLERRGLDWTNIKG